MPLVYCKICAWREIDAINAELMEGMTRTSICSKYHIGANTLQRHIAHMDANVVNTIAINARNMQIARKRAAGLRRSETMLNKYAKKDNGMILDRRGTEQEIAELFDEHRRHDMPWRPPVVALNSNCPVTLY